MLKRAAAHLPSLTSAPEIIAELRSMLTLIGVPALAARELKPDEDLFDCGALDSISFIGLVVKVEKSFGFRFSTADFEIANFKTLETLARLVARRRSDRRPALR